MSESNPRIGVASNSFSRTPALRLELQQHFPNSVFNEKNRQLTDTEIKELLGGAEGAVIGTEYVGRDIIEALPQLKILSKYGVGLDNVDEAALKQNGVALGWTAGINKRSVSELTLCFMLGLCRNIFRSGWSLKQGDWRKDGGWQLSGKTVGVIGCGNVGSDVVRLLSPLGCSLLVRDIVDKSDFCREHKAIPAGFEEAIGNSDVVTLHVPLTEATRNMIDETVLQRMKPTAFLVNTSRGEVVHQPALKRALTAGTIQGAALDVFAEEPPSDMEFLSLPNLMVTPHIGGNAREAVEAMGRSAIRHLVDFFHGR